MVLDLSISNSMVSSKIYDKQDDFNFDQVNFLFLEEDVPPSCSYGLYISSLQCYTRSTIAHILRKMSILIFDATFITDLRIIPEG